MKQNDVLGIMGNAVESHPIIFDIMNNVNIMMSSYEVIINRWEYFMQHNIPIITSSKEISGFYTCMRDVDDQINELMEYIHVNDIDNITSAILMNYISEQIKSINRFRDIFQKAVMRAFIQK